MPCIFISIENLKCHDTHNPDIHIRKFKMFQFLFNMAIFLVTTSDNHHRNPVFHNYEKLQPNIWYFQHIANKHSYKPNDPISSRFMWIFQGLCRLRAMLYSRYIFDRFFLIFVAFKIWHQTIWHCGSKRTIYFNDNDNDNDNDKLFLWHWQCAWKIL